MTEDAHIIKRDLIGLANTLKQICYDVDDYSSIIEFIEYLRHPETDAHQCLCHPFLSDVYTANNVDRQKSHATFFNVNNGSNATVELKKWKQIMDTSKEKAPKFEVFCGMMNRLISNRQAIAVACVHHLLTQFTCSSLEQMDIDYALQLDM